MVTLLLLRPEETNTIFKLIFKTCVGFLILTPSYDIHFSVICLSRVLC